MRTKTFLATIALATAFTLRAEGLKPFPVTPEWEAKIRALAPEKPRVAPRAERRVLIFSLSTGFQHWVTPHTAAVLRILAEKTGACRVELSDDIEAFSPERLKGFDAVVLNNNCSANPDRHLFLDVLVTKIDQYGERFKPLPEGERRAKAKALEESLIRFVENGGGLMAVHGAIVIFNKSEPFGEMLGGNFAFHPKQQEVVATPVEPDHPLVAAFGGKPFTQIDEPYIFSGAYAKKNFRPLLVMDTSKLEHKDMSQITGDVRYISWIKTHGKGRVFYVSPSHNAQSFEDPRLLRYFLDGLQYALGDLVADASPRKP